MNQITKEIEDSLKSIYGNRWRQVLFIHLLIGVGRIIANRIKSIDPECKGKAQEDYEQPAEKPEPVTRIEQNPLDYVRSRSRKIAEILDDELHSISQIAVISTVFLDSRYIGDLIQAIGAQALERLKENKKRRSRTFPEELTRRAWRRMGIGVTQGTRIVVRWLYLISGAYSRN